MPRRAFGIAGVAVGLVAIVVAIARALDGADRITLRVVVVVVLLAVMLASARAAMTHDLHRLDVRVRAGGPPAPRGAALQPVVRRREGRALRAGRPRRGARRRDGPARPRARSRAARTRRRRPRRRLPRHGRRRRVAGARRVDRDRARAAVRVRQRRNPQPLRARSRAEPRGSARVDAGVPRRRRADRRLRDRERAPVREQRVARRLRPDRAGRVVPRREGRDDEDPAPGDARTTVGAVRSAVHDSGAARMSTARS